MGNKIFIKSMGYKMEEQQEQKDAGALYPSPMPKQQEPLRRNPFDPLFGQSNPHG